MSATWTVSPGWLLQSALGGGLLLLVAWAVMKRHGQPARRHFLGLLGVTAALVAAVLCLGPRWLVLPVELPLHPGPALVVPVLAEAAAGGDVLALEAVVHDDEAWADGFQAVAVAEPAGFSFSAVLAALPPWLAAGWAVGATLLLGRWLLGYFLLARLLRAGRPAPPRVAELFAALAGATRPLPRLLVSARVRVPLSCGLLRPTVVLPPDLCDADEGVLRWVFAHELTHLERRDALTGLLFGLAQAVYFYLPWFWWLRRQVRLCQEFLADAAAARAAGSPEDYAQFLLSLTKKPAVPLGATGVTGNNSDLYRRVSMLLQSPNSVEKRCGWLWSLAASAGLLALAVCVSGVGLRAEAADDKKETAPNIADVKLEVVGVEDSNLAEVVVFVTDATGKVIKVVPVNQDDGTGDKEKRKEGKKGEPFKIVIPDVEDIIKKLPAGLSEEQLKQLREQMKRANEDVRKANEEVRKAMEQVQKQMPEFRKFKPDHEAFKKAMEDFKAALEKDLTSDKRKEDLHKALEAYRKALEVELPKANVIRAEALQALQGLTRVAGQPGRLAVLTTAGQGRLGIRVDQPSDALREQLDLPKGQGLVITDVTADSAAAKAGFKANDVLLEFAGKKVPNDADVLADIVKGLKANEPVDALVLRKGKKETIKGVTVGEAGQRRSLRLQYVPDVQVQPKIEIQPWIVTPARSKIEVQAVPGGKSVTTTIHRTNDDFTATHKEGDVSISVAGKVEGGKAKASSIEVKEGDKTTKYDSVDKVPEQHRDRVKKLLESLDGGGAKIEFKPTRIRTTPVTPATPAVPAKPAPPAPPKKPAGRDILQDTPDQNLPFRWQYALPRGLTTWADYPFERFVAPFSTTTEKDASSTSPTLYRLVDDPARNK